MTSIALPAPDLKRYFFISSIFQCFKCLNILNGKIAENLVSPKG